VLLYDGPRLAGQLVGGLVLVELEGGEPAGAEGASQEAGGA